MLAERCRSGVEFNAELRRLLFTTGASRIEKLLFFSTEFRYLKESLFCFSKKRFKSIVWHLIFFSQIFQQCFTSRGLTTSPTL